MLTAGIALYDVHISVTRQILNDFSDKRLNENFSAERKKYNLWHEVSEAEVRLKYVSTVIFCCSDTVRSVVSDNLVSF